MCRVKTFALFALVASSVFGEAQAQSLRVSPLVIEFSPAAKTAILNVGNDDKDPVAVQARIFRWTLQNGEDHLEKTSDVVVSPPLLNVRPGSQNLIRVVRVSDRPVEGEESYRLFVEELPNRIKKQANAITLLSRHSVPVFFDALDARVGDLSWSAAMSDNKLILQAKNPGQKRLKLSGLRLTDSQSREVASISGLAGYVLGGQTKSWELPATQLHTGAALSIEAQTEAGPINAKAVVGKSG